MLAMYEAVDTYNMEAMFRPYHQQFVDLQTEPHLEVNREKKALCVFFLFGDYEFVTKLVGHNGPNAVYPCLWCYVHMEELQKPLEERTLKAHSPMLFNTQSNKWESNPERTPREMLTDLAANKADGQERGNLKKKTSKYYHSVFADPLFPMCTDHMHIVPPVLHIMLGLTVQFYQKK